jgi:hypothetical protein
MADQTGRRVHWFSLANDRWWELTACEIRKLFSSLLLGPTDIGGLNATMTLVGNLVGGGTLKATFPNLTAATLATLNWSNLSSVVIQATDDAALDDIPLSKSGRRYAARPSPSSVAITLRVPRTSRCLAV